MSSFFEDTLGKQVSIGFVISEVEPNLPGSLQQKEKQKVNNNNEKGPLQITKTRS